ncbi:DUF433 domain-containing protein [Belliella aquatica]|uniref:DUF433 domain-containing protein n=1 Tax=Belliella aquatica TaxID=1323734 RepID=A0ABQ1MZZ5_9BACT|nr:DUF433 domain-containing protein [Belliella aquatica]MCH7403999.1 DUF433 domain-containing protein [Belliella aquatica]GGC49974.1 hypothetical protein GCM10010993_30620 [Belliella aquatica]
MKDYKENIFIDPSVRFGKPCIKGTRISVYDILSWLASGMEMDEIISDYPELTKSDIQACLAYAADRENRIRVA